MQEPVELAAGVFDVRDEAPLSGLEQIRFDALMDPSRQRNCSPTQRSTPPFFPEHG
ncbi:hypothetical protein D3C75_1219520 [compost metagenome]